MDDDEEGAENADPDKPAAFDSHAALNAPATSTLAVPQPDTSQAATPQDDEAAEPTAELTLDPSLATESADLLASHDITGDLADPALLADPDLLADPALLDNPSDLSGVNGDIDFGTLGADPMDMLPPDGTAFEAVHDLSQMEEGDDLLGGKVMDESADPFTNVA
jgi:hypothetical protein